MHYLDSDQVALWAGIQAWVAVLDGLTMGLTAGEVAKMAAITAGTLAASGTLCGREINEIIAATKKVLWTSSND
jgi:hypothetical protein